MPYLFFDEVWGFGQKIMPCSSLTVLCLQIQEANCVFALYRQCLFSFTSLFPQNVFPQNFHTRKLGEITVFFTVINVNVLLAKNRVYHINDVLEVLWTIVVIYSAKNTWSKSGIKHEIKWQIMFKFNNKYTRVASLHWLDCKLEIIVCIIQKELFLKCSTKYVFLRIFSKFARCNF